MKLTISETANLAGVTVRTLQYYDKIGLLRPSHVTVSGYRFYEDEALEMLQQILFYRELEFPLKEIKKILSHPDYDKQHALKKQKELLKLKKERLDKLILLADGQLKGETKMSFQEFDMKSIEYAKKTYAAEVKERWGDSKAYKKSMKKTNKYSEEDWKRIQKENEDIFSAFAAIRTESPGCDEALALVKRWQDHISAFSYECTNEILAGLGQMYAADKRFAKNIDQAGEGTAKFMSEAIRIYCK